MARCSPAPTWNSIRRSEGSVGVSVSASGSQLSVGSGATEKAKRLLRWCLAVKAGVNPGPTDDESCQFTLEGSDSRPRLALKLTLTLSLSLVILWPKLRHSKAEDHVE
jgi:hypothetical protein